MDLRSRSRFGNQSFRKLAKKFNDMGMLFIDDQFRSADSSVYHSTQYRHKLDVGRIVWLRPKELHEQQQANRSKDGQQSKAAANSSSSSTTTLLPAPKWSANNFATLFCYDGPNQWLIAAALAIAEHRTLLTQLIALDEEQHLRKTGIVKCSIWQFGIWHKVVVEDKLPVDGDQLVFTRPYGTEAYWLPLLEKAYAKLYGSYEALATHGTLQSALVDLTGGGTVQCTPIGAGTIDVMAKEHSLKSLILLKTKVSFADDKKRQSPIFLKDFKSGAFGLVANRYYLVRHIKKHSSSGGTLKRITSKASFTSSPTPISESSASPTSSHHQSTVELLSTIYEAKSGSSANSSFTFSGPKLQELTIPANEIPKHFDSLTLCRPYLYNRSRIERLTLHTVSGMQLCFDVHSSSSAHNNEPPTVEVQICLMQRSLTNPVALGFRLHAVELNRRHQVHNFASITLVASFDPLVSRCHIQLVRLPVGRYLLTPICNATNQELALMVSISGPNEGAVSRLCQLTQDMPRYQPMSFMSPKYPLCVSRLVVHSVEGLAKQDRFGSANPYCIIRHSGKVIKSYCLTETLEPKWHNLSAIIYHKKMSTPIQVEIWHRTLLMDYFIGLVKLLPSIMPEDGNEEESNKPEEDIKTASLTDKKGATQRAGKLHYQLWTYENLKHF